MKYLHVFLLFAFACVGAEKGEKTGHNNGTFVATKEWQEIKEGQGIPAGLHVRINLQTGKKEAKLLDDSEENTNVQHETVAASSVLVVPVALENANETQPKFGKTIGEALKRAQEHQQQNEKAKEEDLDSDSWKLLDYSPPTIEQTRKKYKSYKEMKETFKKMRLSFKTDAEIISALMREYKDNNLQERREAPYAKPKWKLKVALLEKFNYLVHQIDNAMWFINEGGLDKVLMPMLNETQIELRVASMRVLGALTQNNPRAQIKVFEAGFGRQLSQILITSSHTEELSTALYAFGSLLRKFPHAQLRILSTYGMQALVAILSKECELKIKAKAITLISDVIVEKRYALTESDPAAAEQYAELNFIKWLNAHEYCEAVDTLITTSLYDLLAQPNQAEYFVQGMESTHGLCSSLWAQSPQLRHALLTIKNRFLAGGGEGSDNDEYQLEIAAQLDKLIASLQQYSRQGHSEL